MGDAEALGHGDDFLFLHRAQCAFYAEGKIAAHVDVREQAGFLEDIADGTLPGRCEAAAFVLPAFVIECDVGLARALQAGHAAQQRGLART